MINHLTRHSLLYFGYVLPVVLNVGIFRYEGMNLGPEDAHLVTALTIVPLYNWVVPAGFILDFLFEGLGRLILP